MKIVQTCEEKPKKPQTGDQLPIGTVYKTIGNSRTHYLRINEGHLDLAENHHYRANVAVVDLIYPNARIVLE